MHHCEIEYETGDSTLEIYPTGWFQQQQMWVVVMCRELSVLYTTLLTFNLLSIYQIVGVSGAANLAGTKLGLYDDHVTKNYPYLNKIYNN